MQSWMVSGFNPSGVGLNAVQQATLPHPPNSDVVGPAPGPANAKPAPGQYNGPLAGLSVFGEPFAVFLGMIVVLVLLKALGESDKIPGNPAHLRIGGYNLLAVGVSASVFIVLFKVLANRFPVPGVYQFANAL